MPEDYNAMALKLAMRSKERIDAKIPSGKSDKSPSSMEDTRSTSLVKSDNCVTALRDLKTDMTKWGIKVRVTKKHEVKSCKGGAGHMQILTLLDHNNTEIQATFFDDSILKISETMTEGKVTLPSYS